MARNVIERTFWLLKMHWNVLRNPTHFPIDTQNDVILACFYIHNLIRQQIQIDQMEHQLATIIKENNQNVNYIDNIETSNQLTAWRDNLAREMFDSCRARE